jgi:hypothetical protein
MEITVYKRHSKDCEHKADRSYIRVTDTLIRTHAPSGQVRVIDLMSDWRRKPASEKSYRWASSLLQRNGHETPPTMTMGQASTIINRIGAGAA